MSIACIGGGPAGLYFAISMKLRDPSREIHLFEPRHFVIPFLAHALGTLAGALAAYAIAITHKRGIAMAIGGFFLFGGVAASFMISAPAWFIALDLLVAYLPMACLGAWLGARLTGGTSPAPA